MLELIKINPDSESRVEGLRNQTSYQTKYAKGTADSMELSNIWFVHANPNLLWEEPRGNHNLDQYTELQMVSDMG